MLNILVNQALNIKETADRTTDRKFLCPMCEEKYRYRSPITEKLSKYCSSCTDYLLDMPDRDTR